MQVSEQFQKVMGATIASVLVIAAAIFVTTCINPPARVSAQNGGVVGIQAINKPVFSAQGATASSAIFQDIGQGVNILRYCDTGFTGTINLEWSPTGVAPFLALASATYAGNTAVDTGCHSLTVNGYWPNMRSTLTWSAGTVSANYSAVSGPTGFASPGIASSGPVSPAACDHFSFSTPIAPSIAAPLIPGIAGQTIYVCEMTVSFSATTTAGFLQLGQGTNSGGCPSFVATWAMDILSTTPQTFQVGGPLGSFLQIGQGQSLCVSTGANTANTVIAFSWTQLAQ